MAQAFRFRVNGILFLHSLPANEVGVVKRLVSDLEVLSTSCNGLPIQGQEVSSFSDLLMALTGIEQRYQETGYCPLIHFDAHGAKTGIQFADGSFASWGKIVDRLERLNGVLRMNLVLSLGICEGAAAILGLKGLLRAPFVLLLAPPASIRAEVVDSWCRHLFLSIIRDQSLSDALRSANAQVDDLSRFEPYTFKDLFELGLNGYINDHCDRASLRSRAARILRGMRRTRTDVQLGGHSLSKMVDKLRFRMSDAEKMWARFAWHDLGNDVSQRTPFALDIAEATYRRNKNGKEVRRVIRRSRRSDDIYGRLTSYVLGLREEHPVG